MKATLFPLGVIAALLALPLLAHSQQELAPSGAGPATYEKPYQFGSDWFSVNVPVWREHLAPLKGKPGLHYLEIGPYEGRSFFWAVENILTHPTSRATAIDIFDAGTSTHYEKTYEQVFRSNVELSGAADRITTLKARSQDALRKLPDDSFDLIYVDGSHAANDVLADLVLSWPLLKQGGLMILDDYMWRRQWPFYLRPHFAINSFISAYSHEIEVVHRAGQGPEGETVVSFRVLNAEGDDAVADGWAVISPDGSS